MSKARKELESSIGQLSLSPKNNKKPSSTPKKKTNIHRKHPIADSWEDDSLSSGSETDRGPSEGLSILSPQSSSDYPSAPPPTPISSSIDDRYDPFAQSSWAPNGGIISPSPFSAYDANERSSDHTRPEKTDAVAKRMIAGALGVRAPKKTEEQRAYERAVREKEIKRRNGELEARRRAEEEAKKAKAAAWDG